MKKLSEYLADYQYTYVSLFICLILICGFHGCTSQCPSIQDPNRRVDIHGLNAEVDAFIATALARYDSLEAQEEFKQKCLNAGLNTAKAFGFDYFGLVTTAGTILAGGATVDNIRLRRKKLSGSSPPTA